MVKPAFKLHSPENGTEYSLFVSEPSTERPLPTFLLIDGDLLFSDRVNLIPALASLPVRLVGVGYGAGHQSPLNRRGRDCTPVAHDDIPDSGGAHAFLRFLTRTLWPEIERRYPVAPEVRGIAGHSIGALFVLHALFQPRSFFTHFLASAPSIWWAERALLKQAASLRATQLRLPAKLFLGIGGDDSGSMTGDLRLLEGQLAANPFTGLEFKSQVFPGYNHYNVVPAAFAAGLDALLGDL